MNTLQRNSAMAMVMCACLLSTSCMAQQADVVKIKRELDARITKLDQSKVELQQAVDGANHALHEANTIIATQRAEIKELLAARAEVMDQVTTIKDGDLTEVRGAIDQSAHHLRTVTQRIEALNQDVHTARLDAQESEQRWQSVVKQLTQQIQQQNEIVTAQAEKLSEFQGSFVDFKSVLDTLRQALVDQEARLVAVNAHVHDLSSDQTGSQEVARANWEQVKQSVDSVVTAFEHVSQTLADRLDEHERRLSKFVQVQSEIGSAPQKASYQVPTSLMRSLEVNALQESIASVAPAQSTRSEKPATKISAPGGDRLFERPTILEGSFDRLDRSKIKTAPQTDGTRLRPQDQVVAAYQRNYELLRAGDLEKAFEGFARFIKTYPGSSLAANAQYWLGECFYSQRKYSQAIREFERVLTSYPRSRKVPAALLKIGYSHLGLQDPKTARSMFRQLVRSYPKSRAAAKAYAKLTESNKPSKEAS